MRTEYSFFRSISLSRYQVPRFRDCSIRPAQAAMADRILLEGAGITVHDAPTGTGKSLAYLLPALETGHKAVVLTATRALQDQLVEEFDPVASDLRGAQNFRCVSIPEADCSIGGMLHCRCRRPEFGEPCPYLVQFGRAARSLVVVSNYAMWFSLMDSSSLQMIGGAPYYLICDEAHMLLDLLTSASQARFTFEDLERLGAPIGEMSSWSLSEWKQWAAPASEALPASAINAEHARFLFRVRRSIDNLLRIGDQDECWSEWDEAGFVAAPVWPKSSFQRYVAGSGAECIVLTSATISREICSFVGLTPGRYRYYEYDSGFPPELAPVYFYDAPVLGYQSPDEDWAEAVRHAEAIASRYRGRRGIIYTSSYQRSQLVRNLFAGSHPEWIFHDDSASLPLAISRFRCEPGSVLVSPSIVQGYDFPDDLCEFIIVLKCPYPDMGSGIVRRRMARTSYMDAVMALTLVQVCGRGVRHAADRCDCHVLDGAASRTLRRRPNVFPQWFRRRIRRAERVNP